MFFGSLGGSSYGLSKFYGYRDSPWFSRLFKRPYSRLFKRSGGLDDSAEQDQVDDVKKTKKEKKSCCPGSRTGKKSVPFNDFEVTIPQYIRLKRQDWIFFGKMMLKVVLNLLLLTLVWRGAVTISST